MAEAIGSVRLKIFDDIVISQSHTLSCHKGTKRMLCLLNSFVCVGGLRIIRSWRCFRLYWSVVAHECRSFNIRIIKRKLVINIFCILIIVVATMEV